MIGATNLPQELDEAVLRYGTSAIILMYFHRQTKLQPTAKACLHPAAGRCYAPGYSRKEPYGRRNQDIPQGHGRNSRVSRNCFSLLQGSSYILIDGLNFACAVRLRATPRAT